MFPTLSVTLIGLLVGAAVMLVTRSNDWTTLLVGQVGAWVGFAVGAVIGVVIDIIASTSMWLALSGHVLALVGAAIAVRSRLARLASTPR